MASAPPNGCVSLLGTPVPGRARFAVDGLKRQPQMVADGMRRSLLALPGIHRVEANPLTGHVLVRYDPRHWSSEKLLEAAGEALDLRPAFSVRDPVPPEPQAPANGNVPGRVRIPVAGLRHQPEREGSVERYFGGLTGVQAAEASAWTGRVLVRFDPTDCRMEDIVAAAAALVAVPDPPTDERVAPELPDEAAEPWHAMDVAAVAEALDTDLSRGLSADAAAAARSRVGPNAMPVPREPSLGELIGHQVANAPTALLAVSAGISLVTGGVVQAALVVAVLGANAAIGALTERHGNRAIAALRAGSNVAARVRRDGEDELLDAAALVPGDLILLTAGEPIPADARIVESDALMVEESALTGESRAVEKDVAPVAAEVVLADRYSMVYRGTTVIGGRGSAIVVATGSRTVIGQVHLLAARAEAPPTPMERELDRLGRILAVGVGVVTVGVAALSIWRRTPWLQALQVAIALGVAAIPEGLTALATSVLALASGRLRQQGTLIRTLGAAEALGAVTVVCADKTGTITENRMAAPELYAEGKRVAIRSGAAGPRGGLEMDGTVCTLSEHAGVETALLVGVLCSDAEVRLNAAGDLEVEGSATEGALQVAALRGGLEPWTLRAAYPRSEVRYRADGRRHMVTVHRIDEHAVALCKGSPEDVLGLCDRMVGPDGEVPLDRPRRMLIGSVNADMGGRAMRVLGLARRTLPDTYGADDLDRGFTFLGLIGLVDPVRPAAAGAVASLREAGIRTVMITGDQGLTAMAVAREIGLAEGETLRVLEAGDLAGLSPEALSGLVRDVHVFARITPEMKLAIVRALQANGEVVAMSGDGINDGPALRAADVGIAMGERGTELARELADVVLSRDDLSQIAAAVEEGRLVRANVRRVLHYLLATNLSEVALVTATVAAGLPDPLTPLQLLWLNLVTDLAPGIGLAVEPREPDLMRRPPEDPQQPILPTRDMGIMALESAAIATAALGAYGFGLAYYGPGPIARNVAFATLMSAQLLHVQLARSGQAPALGRWRPKNDTLTIGMAIAGGLQALALFAPPVRTLLGGGAVPAAGMGVAVGAAVLAIGAIETARQVRAWRDRSTRRGARSTLRAEKGAPHLD